MIEPLARAIAHALTHVEKNCVDRMRNALPVCAGADGWALRQILDNDDYAAETCSAACQDTGLAVFFVEVGTDVHFDGDPTAAINEAVRRAYTEGYFRKSVVASPIPPRVNTGDNTPAIVHYNLVPGDKVKITYLAKGAGSENMGALYMLTPSKGRSGIIDAAVDCMRRAGANPCPPVLLGIGIGGDMELAAILSKRALTRATGAPSPNPTLASLECEILDAVNALGIGVQGFGGPLTALSVAVETAPTHIGMLPVAVNVQCHCVRHCTLEF